MRSFFLLLTHLLATGLGRPVSGSGGDTGGTIEQVPSPIFSHPRGFYSGSLALTISSSTSGATIYYTTDGSEPSGSAGDSFLSPYDHSNIIIDSTTVVRARVFKFGHVPSAIVTQTFFVGEICTLPVISIAIDPVDLWDKYRGIYVSGVDRNFDKDWEKSAHLEWYESADSRGFCLDAGVRIHGGWSRRLPQKSLAVYARKKYGSSGIEYQLFADKPIFNFKSFILRNSGNDWVYTLLRDGMMQTLVKDRMDIDLQGYRPAVVFLNGRYWGIHNLREKLNEHYLESNYGIDHEKVDLLEGNHAVLEGDRDHYRAMMEFLKSTDITSLEAYGYLKGQMDVGEYINYQLAQIYFANTDWFDDNIKYWRPKTENGKWRWMLFDTDYGFNLKLALKPSPPGHNTLKMAADSYLFRRLLENSEFKNEFIQRFVSHLNTTFQPDRVLHIIDSLKAEIESEIPRHIDRWKDSPAPFYGYPFSSIDEWERNIEELREFARQRPQYVRQHIMAKFGLSDWVTVDLEAVPDSGGTIQISDVNLDFLPWSGVYFQGLPIKLTAVSEPGRTFSGWSDSAWGSAPSIVVHPTGDFSAEAHFERTGLPDIVINEINYNSRESSGPGDWVEIHNIGDGPIDISNWRFVDGDDSHRFVLPEDTIIDADGYLVLCRDSTAFKRRFPEIENYVGSFEFGLSNGGELIRLYNQIGDLVDSLTYDDDPLWPIEPDGTGSTLSLATPLGDNGTFQNWVAAPNYGTPGTANGVYENEAFWVNLSAADIASDSARIYLTWTTKSESQNRGFVIYRSINGSGFSQIASHKQDERLQGRLVGRGAAHYVWVDEDVGAGNTYVYLLSSISMRGEEEEYSDHLLSTGLTEPEEMIAEDDFFQNYPNPFNLRTNAGFSLAKKSTVFLAIYNVKGERVRIFIEGAVLREGEHFLEWDGRDDAGRSVSSGVYFFQIQADDFSKTQKILLLK